MIRSFQRRITLLVLCFLLVILAGVVFAINYINWRNLTVQAEQSLLVITENDGHRPGKIRQPEELIPPPGIQEETRGAAGAVGEEDALDTDEEDADDPDDDDDYGDYLDGLPYGRPSRPGFQERDTDFAANFFTYFCVYLDPAENILRWTSDRKNLYTDKDIQTLTSAALASANEFGRVDGQFFRLKDTDSGSLLVVLDTRMEVSRAHSLLKTTVVTGLLAYLLLGLTAALLIRRMARPVQEAFDKQKQFVWDASHELKTPLAVISANAEVLAGEIGDNEWLQYIQSEVKRTDHLVQNLLTLARMDKGTVEPVFLPFDLSQAVLQVALPFESNVYEAGKTLEIDIPDGITFRGDRDMIQQLTVILLDNAVKYSDDGGAIFLTLEAKGPVLRVRNTGPAIPPDMLPRIFDRFFRADTAHSRETPGNGLGLAIAKSIVDAHRGTITAESSPESGTAFTVKFS